MRWNRHGRRQDLPSCRAPLLPVTSYDQKHFLWDDLADPRDRRTSRRGVFGHPVTALYSARHVPEEGKPGIDVPFHFGAAQPTTMCFPGGGGGRASATPFVRGNRRSGLYGAARRRVRRCRRPSEIRASQFLCRDGWFPEEALSRSSTVAPRPPLASRQPCVETFKSVPPEAI